MRWLMALGLLVSAGVATASPASAGCMTNMLGAQYCDAPIQPDGTWQRCWSTQQQLYPTYGGNPGFGVVPAMGNCYQVDPKVPWPVVPIGQPQYRIEP